MYLLSFLIDITFSLMMMMKKMISCDPLLMISDHHHPFIHSSIHLSPVDAWIEEIMRSEVATKHDDCYNHRSESIICNTICWFDMTLHNTLRVMLMMIFYEMSHFKIITLMRRTWNDLTRGLLLWLEVGFSSFPPVQDQGISLDVSSRHESAANSFWHV